MKSSALRLAILASLLAAPAAHAEAITWELRGQITVLGGDIDPEITVGDEYRLLLDFDTDSPLLRTRTDAQGGKRFEYDAFASLRMRLTIDGVVDPPVYEFLPEALGQIFVRDNYLSDTGNGTPQVPTDGLTWTMQLGDFAGDGEDLGVIIRGSDTAVISDPGIPTDPDPRLLDMQLHTLQYCRWEGGRQNPDGSFKPCASQVQANVSSIRRLTGPQLASLTLKTNVVSGCKSVSGTVTLDAPAPVGGRVVTLTDDLAAASVLATVKVPEGALSRNFSVKTVAVAGDETGTIGATVDGATLEQALTVRPMGLSSLSFPVSSVTGGGSLAGTVKLECAAGPEPITVQLASSLPGVAQTSVPSVTIPVGAQTAPFTVLTTPVAIRQRPVISATANETLKTKVLTVNP